ncbi:MAG: DUF502 domain-containing protein [Bosea sp.]|jgi:uncharacterized membrane protein|nr:DUF502 domain-containing protein [Bosea sp. (in: a-proteobacteria)]
MDHRPDLRELGAPAEAPEPDASRGQRLSARLRRYFLTGVVIAGPLTITTAVVWWVITLIDGWVKPLIPASYLPESYLPFAIPGFGLLVALVGLTLLGFLTANLAGRALVEAGEGLLERTPVVRGLYRGMKQIFATVFTANGSTFRTVGLVQYPTRGMWSIVFLSKEAAPEISAALPDPDEHIGVFLPCSPNPTTGFFFYLPRREVIEVAISVEDAAKLVMSAGLIQPEDVGRRSR